MELLKLQDIKLLWKKKAETCISIFMPAHRNGHETLEGLDWREFKNSLKEVTEQLKAKGIKESKIAKLLEKPMELLDDTEFWRHLSDGFAAFIAPGYFKYYSVPLNFNSRVYINDRFYLEPLLPLLAGDTRFYILTLSLKHVRLFEASKVSIREVPVEDIVPQSVDEVLIDREREHHPRMQQSRQYHYPDRSRTRKQRGESASFHGHGGEKDLKENELERFFSDVSQGLSEVLPEEETPMIMMGVESVVTEFRKHYPYNNLVMEIIEGNMDEVNPHMLHEKAWSEMEPFFISELWTAIGQYNELAGTGKASEEVEEIVKASMEGKISFLLIEKDTEIWGKYDPENHQTDVHQKYREGDESLVNLAAVQTAIDRGKVYILDHDDMPETTTRRMAAVFRY